MLFTPSTVIPIIGAALSGTGAVLGAEKGPFVLKGSKFADQFLYPYQWQEIIHLESSLKDIEEDKKAEIIRSFLYSLAAAVKDASLQNGSPLIFAGDHTSAIGTWNGIFSAYSQKNIGLLWIDAHMDSNTPKTSPSGRLHGMPLAALMGYGASPFTDLLGLGPVLQPERVALIGVRSFEPGEQHLLDQLGVKVYTGNEVLKRGFDAVLHEAVTLINRDTIGYGISFDMDVLEPSAVPGVGTPAEEGLELKEVLRAFTNFRSGEYPLLGCEVVEFNPALDRKSLTEKATWQVAQSIFAGIVVE